MHVDARTLPPAGKTTKLGETKNAPAFWKEWDKKYPGTLSEGNLSRMGERISPKVDEHWLQHFPEHQRYLGHKLEHHHLDHGNLTVPLPEPLHRFRPNNGVWHQ